MYATFSGPVPLDATLWAAVLAAGAGAVLSHRTAAAVAGLIDDRADPVHVTIPAGRSAPRLTGVVIHRSTRIDLARHPIRVPPQTRVEETALDLVMAARSLDTAVAVLSAAVGRRLTTAGRLAEALAGRPRVRWRHEIVAALADVAAGCHSTLEWRYLRDVERAHHLPVGDRQHAMRRNSGSRIYQDVRYRDQGMVIELDGRVAHPVERRHADRRRDNAAGTRGEVVLHYGWDEVASAPCAVAAEVARVLRLRGWLGQPRSCGARCSMIVGVSVVDGR